MNSTLLSADSGDDDEMVWVQVNHYHHYYYHHQDHHRHHNYHHHHRHYHYHHRSVFIDVAYRRSDKYIARQLDELRRDNQSLRHRLAEEEKRNSQVRIRWYDDDDMILMIWWWWYDDDDDDCYDDDVDDMISWDEIFCAYSSCYLDLWICDEYISHKRR